MTLQLSFYSVHQIDPLLHSVAAYLQKLNLSSTISQQTDTSIVREFLQSQLPKLDDGCLALVLLDALHWLWMCNISTQKELGENPVVLGAFGCLKRSFSTDSTY